MEHYHLELGADYLDRINAAQLKRYFVKRLETSDWRSPYRT